MNNKDITTKVPIVSSDQLISDVVDQLHEFAQENESINYIYVVDDEKKLRGVVSIKELLANEKYKLMKEIMSKKLVVSHIRVSKKRVAHLAIKHNIKAVPILDDQEKFIGVLTSDETLLVLYKEYRNEMYRSAGIIPMSGEFDTILEQGIWQAFVSRIPWIIIGLVGGIFAARIIEYFEGTLSTNIILAAFIPLIVYISDAVGTQTQTFFVRDIAFNPKLKIIPYTFMQFITTSLIGLICWALVFGIVGIFWHSIYFGMVIGLATFTAIASSTVIAIFIPYVLNLLKQDPATGSGPFATILQDLLSIFVYFLIATALL